MRRLCFVLLPCAFLLPSCGGKATASAPATHADAGDAPAVDTSVPDSPIDASDASIEDGPPVSDHIETCPEGVGPSMVLLPEGFCIDSTPVTRAQYAAWMSTNPTLDGQHKRCKQWNTSYEPDSYCESIVAWDWEDGHPQSCVDWCDALSYCKAAGKRLCGAIDGGKVNGISEASDPTQSQWMAACTSGGTNDYPYGDTYDPEACGTHEPGSFDQLALAGGQLTCQSSVAGYEGVFDLSGSLQEWEDNCGDHTDDPAFPNDGRSDTCLLRGGTAPTTPENARCDALPAASRGANGMMFRCCYP